MTFACPSYSPLFTTLYDEQEPVGQLGRGTHYSVLCAAQWRSPLDGETLVYPLVQRIGVIWDEDHDTRVIKALEAGYMNGLLAPVLFIGERKAALTIVVANEIQVDPYHYQRWSESIERVIVDHWDLEIINIDEVVQHQMIHDSRADAVNTYIANIRNLWELGLHSHPSQRFEGCNRRQELVDFSKRD